MNPADVFFYSDGARIAGYLFTPEDWKPGDAARPGILVLAGYSGNTQADCTHMMKRLCAEGWFVLGYDYRGFGKSEGQRNRHRPLEQAQNTFDALTYMQTVPGIDPERLGLYGTSFGCANGIWVAAHDERVKCLVPPEQQLSCYAKCGEPKKLVKLPKAGHYDSYEFRNAEMCKVVYAETIDWFRRYL